MTKAELLYILTLTAATREREGDRQKERGGEIKESENNKKQGERMRDMGSHVQELRDEKNSVNLKGQITQK